MTYHVNGEEFKHRQKFKINPSAATLTNYQIKKTITYDSDMRPDFSDIRFVTEDGINIPYWIESKTYASTADVWLKLSSISTSTGASIWIYYGNSSLSSASSIMDTMEFGDDFIDDSLDTVHRWDLTAGSVSVANSELTITYSSSHRPCIDAKSAFNFGSNYIFETRLKQENNSSNEFGLSDRTTAVYRRENGDAVGVYINSDNELFTRYSVDDGNDIYDADYFKIDVYTNFKIEWYGTGAKYYKDNILESTLTTNLPDTNIHPFLKAYGAGTMIVDWVFVRKYTVTEPTWAADGVKESSKQSNSTIGFRLIIQKPSGNKDIYYPQVLSGSCTSVYPFAVPTARFVVASNSTVSTSTYLSPVRDDDIVRFQVNHKYIVGEKDVWIDVFEGRVSGIGSVFNSNENSTTIKCIGHGESLKYTNTPTTVGHTAKTTGFILETLMPAMARISNDDTLLDIAGSTSISQFDLKKDSQKIMDVVRDLESLELYGYIFRLQPEYDSDGVLTSVEPVWEAISSTATDKLIINESAQSFISASFESTISKMRNRFTIYGSDDPQVSATVEDTALQATYDVREQVEVDKTIATAAMCTNIATAALARWKNPIIFGTVTIRGNPYIKVGDRVTCNIPSIVINGEPINDTYLIYRVTHNINNGYTTTLVLGEIDMSVSELITSFVLGNRRNNLNGID